MNEPAATHADLAGWGKGALWLTLAFVVLVVTVDFLRSWHQPVLEEHAFRQTHTALTAYRLLQGGPWLAYETPAAGAPWSIPFEFPFFQIVVAATVRLSGLPLDEAGRLVAFLFYLATALTFFRLARLLDLPREVGVIAATLYVFSPEYRFWGRTFLIESCALLLGFLYLVCLLSALKTVDTRSAPWKWSLAIVAGMLAGLVKVTTFSAFLVAGTLASLYFGFSRRRGRLIPLLNVAALAAPVVIVQAWVAFGDGLKMLNPVGRLLVPISFRWYLGGLHQRLDPAVWSDVIWSRATFEALGSAGPWILGAIALVSVRGRALRLALLLVGLYLFVFLAFTNLHIVHQYYQYANSVFLILAAAVGLWSTARGRAAVLLGLLVLVLTGQQGEFRRGYAQRMAAAIDSSTSRTLAVTDVLRARTATNDVVLVYGFDWSPEVAYYSERRALTVPSWAQRLTVDSLKFPERFLGSHRLGAIVVCPEEGAAEIDPEFEPALEARVGGMTRADTADCRIFVRSE